MIRTETVTIDGREFTYTYSDTFKIRKVGTDEIYEDAMDVLDFQYEETDIPLEQVHERWREEVERMVEDE
jgi:hypothetical protein